MNNHKELFTQSALDYLEAGLSVLPSHLKDKSPCLLRWREYMKQRPSEEDLKEWMDLEPTGLSIVCGEISGNLEVIDFDCGGEAFQEWKELVESENEELYKKVVIETSPSGGYHVYYRCKAQIYKSVKLASKRFDYDSNDSVELYGKSYVPKKDADGNYHVNLTMIETRGEGGLIMCSPSKGYDILQGSLTEIPNILFEEREILLQSAWSLNEIKPEAELVPDIHCENFSLRPGDDFNMRGDVRPLLKQHGWKYIRTKGEREYWQRPDKNNDRDISASLTKTMFFNFSSNASPFEPYKGYSYFTVYTYLAHYGKFEDAARQLREEGFGNQTKLNYAEINTDGIYASIDESSSESPTTDLVASLKPKIDLKTFEETKERDIKWIWPGVIPKGMVSMIGGKQGLGKSFVITDLAARFSSGREFPDGHINQPGNVLLLVREDDASCVLKPRISAANADESKVYWSTFSDTKKNKSLDLIKHIDSLKEVIEENHIEFLIVDTFAAFAPAGTDSNASEDVRLFLDALTRLASDTGIGVLVVAHLRKNSRADGDPMDAIAGSTQMTAGVRVVCLLDKGYLEDERLLKVVKCNICRINSIGWVWGFINPLADGNDEDIVPAIEWRDAKESKEMAEVVKDKEKNPSINEDELMDYLEQYLTKKPMQLTTVIFETHDHFSKKIKKLKKTTINEMLTAIINHEKRNFVLYQGDRGQKFLGLKGQEFETSWDRALRFANENPDISASKLTKLAKCHKTMAIEVLKEIKLEKNQEDQKEE